MDQQTSDILTLGLDLSCVEFALQLDVDVILHDLII